MPETRELLSIERVDPGILRLTLNDIGRRNALSEAMLTQIHSAITEAADNTDIRVIIIAANGPAFSAGHDLKELSRARENADGGRAYFALIMGKCSQLMQAMVNCPKPVIAEVDGVATAAGCQLVASCDLAIASTEAQFSTPGVNIGLFCSTPMVALSRNVARKHAMEMLLTGDMMSAEHAAEIGLINRAVPLKDLTETATNLAQKIASKSSMTLSTGKRAFYSQAEMSLAQAYDYTAQVMVENMLAHDAKEGIGAFIEKRQPVWKDE